MTGHQFSWWDENKKAKSIFGCRTVKSHEQKKLHTLSFLEMKESIEVHLNRSNIFLLYFYDAYDLNLQEKFRVSIAYSCKTNVFVEFNHFMKKRLNSFFYTSLFKNRSSSLQERKNIYEIIKLLQYNHHHMNCITNIHFSYWWFEEFKT